MQCMLATRSCDMPMVWSASGKNVYFIFLCGTLIKSIGIDAIVRDASVLYAQIVMLYKLS